MSGFDPSTIADIGASGPDVVGSMAKGFQLKDMVDTQQLNALKLGQEKQSIAEGQKTKSILSSSKLNTAEGLAEAQEKLTKAGLPEKAMELRKYGQQVQSGELDNQLKQAEVYQAAQNTLVNEVDPIVAQADSMRRAGKSDAMINAYIQAQLPLVTMRLHDSNLPPDMMQAVLKRVQGGINYDTLKSIDQSTKQGLERIKSRTDELKAQTGALAEQERTRHDQAMEGQGNRRLDQADAKEEHRRKESAEGVISDDATNLAVDRLLNGEQARDVLANFGRGKQGGNNITKVQNRLAEVANERGIPASEISARMIEMKGLVKEEQTEAGIAGKIRYAESEIKRIGPKVLEISAKVPRGQFVPWNQLKNYSKEKLSDPNLKQLKAYLTTLTNSYDVLGGRGGTDVDKRAHNRELLNAADSPQALQAAVDAIVQEAAISGEAATESETVDRSRLPGGKPTPAAGGTVLKFDAQGNPVK